MPRLSRLLSTRASAAHRNAAALVAGLPAYQIALWPDGWELHPDGAVTVRDTHAMAEARRWYRLAERNRAHDNGRRVMALHGIFVPRAIVDLAHRRFPSEQVASVAMQLVAGDWIRDRRRQLLAAPRRTLRARALAWSGSRHAPGIDPSCLSALLPELIETCVSERLIPNASYGVEVMAEDAFGIASVRCRVEVCLDPYARAWAQEVLQTALIPWNRRVVREGDTSLLIGLEVSARPAMSHRADRPGRTHAC
jgi:hypothetical protein